MNSLLKEIKKSGQDHHNGRRPQGFDLQTIFTKIQHVMNQLDFFSVIYGVDCVAGGSVLTTTGAGVFVGAGGGSVG
jgi:hypothetical protein